MAIQANTYSASKKELVGSVEQMAFAVSGLTEKMKSWHLIVPDGSSAYAPTHSATNVEDGFCYTGLCQLQRQTNDQGYTSTKLMGVINLKQISVEEFTSICANTPKLNVKYTKVARPVVSADPIND